MSDKTEEQKVIPLRTATLIGMLIMAASWGSAWAVMQGGVRVNTEKIHEQGARIERVERLVQEQSVQYARIETRLMGIETILVEVRADQKEQRR